MKTVGESAPETDYEANLREAVRLMHSRERVEAIETILRLMAKHDWTSLTVTEDGFLLCGDDPGSWVQGRKKEGAS